MLKSEHSGTSTSIAHSRKFVKRGQNGVFLAFSGSKCVLPVTFRAVFGSPIVASRPAALIPSGTPAGRNRCNSIGAQRRYPATARPPHAATQAGRSGRAGRPGSAAAPRPKRGRRDQHARAARPAEPARQRTTPELHQRAIRRRKSGRKRPDLSEYWYYEKRVLATFYKTFVPLSGA